MWILTQAGWYADPYGGGGHRWWDGTRWTEHVNATPAQPVQQVQPQQPQPVQPQQGQPQGQQGPVLHKTRYGVELHADSHAITWDGTTIELAKAEFVGYTAVQTRMRGPLNIGSVHTSTDYHFEIGFFPVNEAPGIAFEETGLRANTPPSDWQFLVDLSRTYVEPRLLRQFLAAVEAGQTVDVGKVRINRNGFVGGNVSRGWDGIEGVTFDKGWYFVHARGAAKPILRVPQQNQNVMLLPRIFDALKR
ncbi:DUF2510 domain-containing protein [Actinomadura montaniterrae]|uniref:DUF2510 domain-containing protein n=1 Tax=Actinomadura montaniterrae TaxID=1803903 RepID=A0A6L3VSP0_9ACTN|nr:DUF2510 domain-containing protein [Actinomadura montaniterrae]